MSLGSTEAIKRAVAAGVGVAIVSRLTVAQELQLGRLALVPLSDLSIRRPLHRLSVRGRTEGRAVAAFMALLAEALPKEGKKAGKAANAPHHPPAAARKTAARSNEKPGRRRG